VPKPNRRLSGETGSTPGGVWKPRILFALLDGKKRFGELSRIVPKATQRMLTMHLREVEAHGVIKRTLFANVPLRVEHELTEDGRSLELVLHALNDWGAKPRSIVEISS
jgi:DNA-binding HxlR family transcriptional regulator